MPDLIPIHTNPVDGEVKQTVHYRDLHKFLKISTYPSTWIKRRIEEYGFVEDIDFICLSNLKGGNPIPEKEYHLSLDMAKELSMVERNDQGKRARQYFIAKEKEANAAGRPRRSPMSLGNAHISDCLEAGALFNVPRHIALTHGAQEAERLYGVDYSPFLLNSPDLQNVSDDEMFLEPSGLAAHLGIPVRQVNPLLALLGLQTRSLTGVWTPTDEAIRLGMCTRHQWVKGPKSGYNFMWKVSAIQELKEAHYE